MSEELKKTNRPPDKAIAQQSLSAWQPLITPKWSIIFFLSWGLLLLIFGIILTVAYEDVVERRQRYDHVCPADGSSCTVDLTIEETMDPPIEMRYELRNFYQNHRRYVNSIDFDQLQGSLSTSVAECSPVETNPQGDTIVPCGLIGASIFNDTFAPQLCPGGSGCAVLNDFSNSGIAWDSDADDFYKAVPLVPPFSNLGLNNVSLPSVSDPDLQVWFRLAGLPIFTKLHRRIRSTTLNKGDILRFTVTSNYPVSEFDGEKHIVLLTTNFLLGPQNFLGWLFISFALASLAFGGALFAKMHFCPRLLRLGDAVTLDDEF